MRTEQTSNHECQLMADAQRAFDELAAVRVEMLTETDTTKSLLDAVHATYQESARNLLHYLALRRRDLRPLQSRLAAMGLSSLGRAESHVLATVDSVLNVLSRVAGTRQTIFSDRSIVDFEHGPSLLQKHAEELLGPTNPQRRVRIMVTMPSEAANDPDIVHDLLAQGMNCMRINCAHDDSAVWLRMIENLRLAERALGRSCKVAMDLAGPKLRTGAISPGPEVIKIRPLRNEVGKVIAPARLWFTSQERSNTTTVSDEPHIPVPSNWLAQLSAGDTIKMRDARDAKRSFSVVEVNENACCVESLKTVYLVSGTRLHLTKAKSDCESVVEVGRLPPTEIAIELKAGDLLILTRDLALGRSAKYDDAGHLLMPARIGCTIPEIFNQVKFGEPIFFDDGKIGGFIEQVEATQLNVRIAQAGPNGEKLRADKGINLPESELQLAALTAKDLDDLQFVARHADIVELSFANTPDDVDLLQKHLAGIDHALPAIVLKIETRRGFESLPEMLFTAMRAQCCGVMIARGDLAVECGFERLAEVQEEILWVCEAAHVPVIWATQVLESLAKEGQPSRAEITDVAMGDRAECVMLNKGPHVLSAVRVLDDILTRMQAHQSKKRSLLRELRLAHLTSDA